MKRFVKGLYLMTVVYAFAFLTVPTIQSQPYPNRPIQLINPTPAGGGGDISSRLLVADLEKILGARIIVTNKPGASDTLGTDFVAKGKKDGYTLLYAATSAMVYALVTSPEIVPYDPVKDLEPLGLHMFFPLAVAVQESSPWKSFSELVDYAKKNPGKLRVSTAGTGSTSNFDVEITQSLTGVQFNHVPFKGGEAVITALLGGHVEVTYDQLGKFLPHVESGKLRLLLVSKKMPWLPNLPTITELGYKQDLLSGWFGLFAPAGVPEGVKKVLVPAIEKAAKDPQSKVKLEKMGFVVDYKSPAELKKLMIDDYDRAIAIAIKLGLRK